MALAEAGRRRPEEHSGGGALWGAMSLYQRFEHAVILVLTGLIAILAMVRKLIIFDLSTTSAGQLFALAATLLALGGVHWLICDQDRRERNEYLGSDQP